MGQTLHDAGGHPPLPRRHEGARPNGRRTLLRVVRREPRPPTGFQPGLLYYSTLFFAGMLLVSVHDFAKETEVAAHHSLRTSQDVAPKGRMTISRPVRQSSHGITMLYQCTLRTIAFMASLPGSLSTAPASPSARTEGHRGSSASTPGPCCRGCINKDKIRLSGYERKITKQRRGEAEQPRTAVQHQTLAESNGARRGEERRSHPSQRRGHDNPVAVHGPCPPGLQGLPHNLCILERGFHLPSHTLRQV